MSKHYRYGEGSMWELEHCQFFSGRQEVRINSSGELSIDEDCTEYEAMIRTYAGPVKQTKPNKVKKNKKDKGASV